ncbi:pyridoxamine 5'-phosphate oxidase family protein [Rivihabitans pingtungensis]|uniref:pyridoxamine 5'-phosphate oxidase family protein n=1 Tax=Rivihabitans pingtungensis TaxID=1054498 RepID=UPI002352B33E|nr:pyridoxamine 5'-phosphate oxidase family protein [Rivihabitans pingtungensis]MCK6437957.1 pyridoxamine 5'-phosphate oxidase family protein [Rivihabitans pingtungensis]
MSQLTVTDLTRVRRHPERAHYDRDTLHALLDAALICHIAFVLDGQVQQIPTACWREGEHLYIHGSNGSRMIRALRAGASVCVAVSLFDGLVLAKSSFSTSVNYRSALIYGQFAALEGEDAKRASLKAFFEHYLPGRWDEVREPDASELAATTVLALPLEQAVCKVRSGPPQDKAEDEAAPVWAGVLPALSGWGAPQPALGCEDWSLPGSVRAAADA